MYPILYQLGPVTLYSLWVFLTLGFFTGLISINKLVKLKIVKLNFLAVHSLFIFLSGIIISRIFFLIINFQAFFAGFSINKIWEIFNIFDKGLSLWGGIIGIFISTFYLCKKENENFGAWADIYVASIISGMIAGNIGTYLDGRNSGAPTDLPWGITVETSQYAIPIHPVQLYAVIYNLILTVVLFNLFSKKIAKKDGNIAIIGIFLYSICRFLEEFLRGDESMVFLGLRTNQYIALAAILTSGYFLYKKYKNKELNTL